MKKLRDKLKEISNHGEIIAGSEKEPLQVNSIKAILEGADQVRVLPIRVMYWDVKEFHMECDGKEVEAYLMPYSPELDIEFSPSDIKVEKLSHIYEASSSYEEAVKKGKEIFLFETKDFPQKIVVKKGPFLNKKPSPPPPIPAVAVSQDISGMSMCRAYGKIYFNPNASGYNVEAVKNGRDEIKVFVSAHHDHWFSGEIDNLVGVAIASSLNQGRHELRILSFTAEESGALGFATFSWSHGSREYVKEIRPEEAAFSINIDSPYPGSTVSYSTFPTRIGRPEFPTPMIFSDGYSFVKAGIHNVTFCSTGDSRYHSPRDLIKEEEWAELEALKEDIQHILTSTERPNSSYLKVNLENSIEYLPTQTKPRILNLIDRIEDQNVQQDILKIFGGVTHQVGTEVRLFHTLYGISLLGKRSRVDIEDYGRLEIEKQNRFTLNYINELRNIESQQIENFGYT